MMISMLMDSVMNALLYQRSVPAIWFSVGLGVGGMGVRMALFIYQPIDSDAADRGIDIGEMGFLMAVLFLLLVLTAVLRRREAGLRLVPLLIVVLVLGCLSVLVRASSFVWQFASHSDAGFVVSITAFNTFDLFVVVLLFGLARIFSAHGGST